jgi:hypothetical protein
MTTSDLQTSLAAALGDRHIRKGIRTGDRVRIDLEGITAYGTVQVWYPASVTSDLSIELDGTGQIVRVPESIMEKI